MASVTLTSVINTALNFLGILDSGGAATSQQLTDGLLTVNNLIESKSADRLMAAGALVTSFSTVSGTQSYAVGTGQAVNIPKPANIEAATLVLANGLAMGISVVNALEWSMLPDRNKQSYLVKYLFYDRQSPTLGNVRLSPIPLGGNVEIISWSAMTQFADTTTPITVQDAYSRWLRLATALEIAPQYPSAQVTQELFQDYSDATATLRNLNASLFGEAPPAGQVASNATPLATIQPTASEAA